MNAKECCWSGTAMAALMLLTLVTSARAEDDPARHPKNSLHDGAHALQFQFSNWTLRSLQGATLAYKWHFSDRSAWRVGVSTNLDFSDRRDVHAAGDSVLTVGYAGQDVQTVGLSWHYLRYPEHSGRLTPLFETGPSFTYSHSHTKNPGTYSSRLNYVSIGWATAVGAEWFATPGVSIMSEYGLSLAYVYQKEYTDLLPAGRTNTSVAHAYNLDSLPITIGVSVYF